MYNGVVRLLYNIHTCIHTYTHAYNIHTGIKNIKTHTANVSPGVTLISNVGPSYKYTEMIIKYICV